VKLQPDLSVTAFDIDLLAVRTAALNLTRNQLSSVQLFAGEITSVRRRFDLVVANLTLGLFERLAEALLERCENHLILSGLLRDQTSGVIDLFGHHSSLVPVGMWQENDWICLHLRS
jgi:ribosomal protein L11 methylase PrmA